MPFENIKHQCAECQREMPLSQISKLFVADTHSGDKVMFCDADCACQWVDENNRSWSILTSHQKTADGKWTDPNAKRKNKTRKTASEKIEKTKQSGKRKK